MQKGVSIIICCYNSCRRLNPTLQHIALQKVQPGMGLELIVVDNASTDNTAGCAADYWQQYSQQSATRFSVIAESKPGLNNARETGIRAALYTYVLFCDDDNWLAADYAQRAFDFMEANEAVGAVGGKGVAVCETYAPAWLADFQSAYAVGARLPQTAVLTGTKDFIFGAGMVLRKAAWLQLHDAGFTTLLTDRTGTELSSGGDLELCYALRLAGYEIWFNQDLVYQHYIQKERLHLQYLRKLHAAFGQSGVQLDTYQYALNNWPVKTFLWLRICLKLLPAYIKYASGKEKLIKEEMEGIVLKEYVKTLIAVRGRFDAQVQQINRLKKRLQLVP